MNIIKTNEPKSILTVSDWHIDAYHSNLGMYLNMYKEKAKQHDIVVLNGDIFEGIFKPKKDLKRSFKKLRKIIDECPDTDFHFVFGNHDEYESIEKRMKKLSKNRTNIDYHYDYCIINSCLFTHGDRIKKDMINSPRTIKSDIKEKYKKLSMYTGYDLYVKLFESKAPIEKLKNMYGKLRNGKSSDLLQGIDMVGLGHSHKPHLLQIDDVVVFNTGSTTVDNLFGPNHVSIMSYPDKSLIVECGISTLTTYIPDIRLFSKEKEHA